MDASEKLKLALEAWEISIKPASDLKKGDFVIPQWEEARLVVACGKRDGLGSGEPNEFFIAFDNGVVERYTDETFIVATQRPPQERKPVTRSGRND